MIISFDGKPLKEDLIETIVEVMKVSKEKAEELITDEFVKKLENEIYSVKCEHLAHISCLIDDKEI